jgi:hypothetical protein
MTTTEILDRYPRASILTRAAGIGRFRATLDRNDREAGVGPWVESPARARRILDHALEGNCSHTPGCEFPIGARGDGQAERSWTDCGICGEPGSVEPPFEVPAQVWNAGASDARLAYGAHLRAQCHACGAISVVER